MWRKKNLIKHNNSMYVPSFMSYLASKGRLEEMTHGENTTFCVLLSLMFFYICNFLSIYVMSIN